MYIYYTVTLPNGYAWINGVIFRGTYEYSAPLPKFNDLGVASPLLIQLPNGTLMMTWFAVPHGNYGLNNLTVILQGSVLEPNGTWGGPVFNITNNGVALSVTSDGKYLYIIWEPELNLNYTNTELLVTSLTGQLITAMQLPNATALNGALNGNVAIQLLNGTYAVVNVFSRNIEPYIGYSDVGFVNGLFYAFSNDTLTIVNGTSKIEIQTPSEAYAWPSIINGKLLVIAYRPSTLSIYAWNGTALLSINNYTMPNFVIAKPTYSNGFIYITTLTRVMNNSDPTADLWNIILYASSIMPSAPTVSATIPPPSSYLYLRVIAPSYADWMIYSDASDNWYANYTGVGSVVFGPAYVGGPGTTVMFNVTGLGNCPSPSITYEPSNTLSLGYGPNYETVIINCEPMMNVALNITSGGGIIAIINEPGLGQRQLILNGPTTENLELPINTTITIYTWPYTGYTLSGIYVNGTEINYVMNMYGAYVYKVMVNSNQIIMINFNAK
ncbi:hypothetical protein [Vulcanisaeta distributa]|uniref:hypothetical protein n=1 Tax=Vulcanisaeta distributa TaxID=164451 RepID=UPI001FB4AC26|nr:hypothetical protein [Vulcanisaeta distributa]